MGTPFPMQQVPTGLFSLFAPTQGALFWEL